MTYWLSNTARNHTIHHQLPSDPLALKFQVTGFLLYLKKKSTQLCKLNLFGPMDALKGLIKLALITV